VTGNFRLTIEYDGTSYHGWQRQRAVPTVQGAIEAAIETMTGRQVTVVGSGRTDAGVHAWNQVAHFLCESSLKAPDFFRGLNSLLPPDIVIKECRETDIGFHARRDARSKVYEYHILNRSLPGALCRQFAWFIRKELDLDSMRRAMGWLLGTHDFKSFEGSGSPRVHTRRTVRYVALEEKIGGRLRFVIEANGFLRHMVRNIVGTLVEVGMGKTAPEAVEEILGAHDRSRAGATAPAHGLYLREVRY